MCRFRSGILLKDRVVIARKDNDSHQDMLEELNISDTYENAARVFVRAELIPEKNEWWTDPDGWEFVIDQDIVPDWFEEDREGHISRFRAAVKEWWSGHVLVGKKMDTLRTGYYMLKDCEVDKLCGDAMVLLNNSQVGEMRDGSQVGVMRGSSQVGVMRGSSQVREMWGSSQVGKMYNSSQVGEMRDGSQVGEMYDRSQVGEMYNGSTARDFKGYPRIKLLVPDGGSCRFELTAHKNEQTGGARQ